jgi:hypothetical protein
MKKETRTKMQRQVASRRKTWTNALRFLMKQRNERRQMIVKREAEKLMQTKRLLAEAEQETAEPIEVHEHDEHCDHG